MITLQKLNSTGTLCRKKYFQSGEQDILGALDFQQLKEYHSVVDTANCVAEFYFLYEKNRITLNNNNNKERRR